MVLLDIADFIGRFHPLFVHLPIGILLLAIVFQFLVWKQKTTLYARALYVALLLGTVGAVLSCVTGLLLSETAEYDEAVVGWHQWLGISVALVSVAWLMLLRRKTFSYVGIIAAGIVLCLLTITGHLGGTLTHGEDYLSFDGAAENDTTSFQRQPLADPQNAMVYADIIQPVLNEKCYSCHGDKKQKGKLRLDLPEFISKGGKNGPVIEPLSTDKSELVQRLMLPRSDKKHMPPKDKKQLTADEIALIHWWVESGASFDKKVQELPQPAKIHPVLTALGKVEELKKNQPIEPAVPVEKAPVAALDSLKKRGIIVLPLSANSNYLSANFVSTEKVTDSDLRLLLPLKKQLISLKVGDQAITDSALLVINECTQLRKLHLNNTDITDKGLALLSKLTSLEDLNLVGTAVTAKGVLVLKGMKSLQNVYLYKTAVNAAEWKTLEQAFPSTRLDSGNYFVPILKTDTSFVKSGD
jgi:uncharacterized membrane protein